MTDIYVDRYEQSPAEKDELPDELKAELRESRTHDLESNLTRLFDDGKQRTINETLIDYWHAHKTIIKRQTVIQTLATMAKGGRAVRRAGKGVYVTNRPESPAQTPQPVCPPMPGWQKEPNKITCAGAPYTNNGKKVGEA